VPAGSTDHLRQWQLPGPLITRVAAVNAHDTKQFVEQFASDGWVDDNGPPLRRRDQIEAWSALAHDFQRAQHDY
jgi:hypothetical protein